MTIGINFRATSGYVTDGAGETYCVGDSYPTTRGGWTFGWTATGNFDIRDRDSAIDRRLAGTNLQWNDGTQSTFRLDLPASGQRDIRLALGDTISESYQYCQIKDGTTVLLTTDDSNGNASYEWVDASAVARTQVTWPTSNVAVPLTFTGTILNLILGPPTAQGANHSDIAHLNVGDLSVAPPRLARIMAPQQRMCA
jgi:hypothetical protein